MLKKITGALALLILLCFCLLLTCYAANERMIENYKNKEYTENVFSVLGITEKYIAPYNQGNVYFKQGCIELAEKMYEEALSYEPKEGPDCLIRINLVLARTAELDVENIKAEEIDETIDMLEDCVDLLCENGCAAEKKKDSHNEDAQQLKEDLEDLIEQLKEMQESQDKEQEDGDSSQDEDEQEESGDSAQDLKAQYEELEEQGTQQRLEGLDTCDYIFDFSYYDGRCW